jgi:hypothetical protein
MERLKQSRRGEDNEYRAEEAENGVQQSDFLNTSTRTIDGNRLYVNGFRQATLSAQILPVRGKLHGDPASSKA